MTDEPATGGPARAVESAEEIVTGPSGSWRIRHPRLFSADEVDAIRAQVRRAALEDAEQAIRTGIDERRALRNPGTWLPICQGMQAAIGIVRALNRSES
jgi:hypothetical protein